MNPITQVTYMRRTDEQTEQKIETAPLPKTVPVAPVLSIQRVRTQLIPITTVPKPNCLLILSLDLATGCRYGCYFRSQDPNTIYRDICFEG